MAYNQPGLADPGQYTKAAIGTRAIGGQQVTTARNPQSVENTQSLGAAFDWEDRFEMLGLRLPPAAAPGTPSFRLLVWLQRQRGGLFANRYDLNFDQPEIVQNALAIGITAAEVPPAIKALLDANILYKVGALRVSESRQEAGTRLGQQSSTTTGSFTLRKEWVVSVTGDREAAFAAATTPAKMAASPEYETMGKAAVYRDYVKFLQDGYLQKATNAMHDYFCEHGVLVTNDEAPPEPVFKVYGDNAMLNRESARGLRHSATTANMSRNAILSMAHLGQEPWGGNTQNILARLPSHAVLPPPLPGGPIPLDQWHALLENSGWLAAHVFEPMNAVVNAVAGTLGASLGDVTRDHPGDEAF
jgi:hypothetical protein